MLVNPYIAGNPVGGSEAFVGRTDILRTVLRVLKNPGENAIVLYGQRRIGKTSVLLELMRRLPQEGPYQPIYFDLQDKAALPLSTVLRELMQRIAAATGMPAPTVTNDALPEQFQITFLQAVLQQLSTETSLVLLFDEFDVLDNPGEGQAGTEFFPYLRNLLTLNPRLQFGFVIGRRPEDLSSFTLSIFKGIKAEPISLLTATDTTALVRLSEQNGSLHWAEEAIAQVYALTGGHPFLTQQLCQELWETAWQDDSTETPLITPAAIDAAIDPTLRSATNALEWLWDGLRPAQRIVAAALAEAGPDSITQEELESRLQQSGVRILVGELQDAPRTLQDWDMLEPGKTGYRFRVELLRRWLVKNKPLTRVQEEIDYIQPVAENLFQAAYAFYQGGQLEQALPLLRQTVALNPNHLRGTQVLSEILLAQKEVDEARQLLENLYQYHPGAARPRLVQALLIQANAEQNDDQQNMLFDRILELEPNQREAKIWRQQRLLSQLVVLEKAEKYEEALVIAHKLVNELPPGSDLSLVQRKIQLADLYTLGLNAMEVNGYTAAAQLFTQIISLEPTYRDAIHHLYYTITRVNVREIESRFKQCVLDLDAKHNLYLQYEKLVEDFQKQTAEQSEQIEHLELIEQSHAQIRQELDEERKKRQQLEALERQLRDEFIYKLGKEEQIRKELEIELGKARKIQQGQVQKIEELKVSEIRGCFSALVIGIAILLAGIIIRSSFNKLTSNQSQTPPPVGINTPTHSESLPPRNTITVTKRIDARYAITFVYVPAGEFLMGSSSTDPLANADEKPQHIVWVDAFWIMQTEVTNEQYRKCMDDGVCDKPNNNLWNGVAYNQHPVTHVNWEQASQYAAWVGGRLPTEAEWEKAARGTDARIYPWGDVGPDSTLLNYDRNQEGTNPVNTYPLGISPYGALDMSGNVWEWIGDWYVADYYPRSPARTPLGPMTGEARVLRGGSWTTGPQDVRSTNRSEDNPLSQFNNVGFRVVRMSSP